MAELVGGVIGVAHRRWRGGPSVLPVAEHTTDTHGATETVFALVDLLGLSFLPRLRDAGDLRLHRIGPPTGLPVDALLKSTIQPARITGHYDDLLRTAGSLKRGWVPASLLISRMQAATPKPPLAAALSEYGRLIRTNFLLNYLADAPLRRRITAQLNKGETLHALRRHIAFGQRQQLPADEDDHRRHALCLQLVVNATLIWNARDQTAAIDQLHEEDAGALAGQTPGDLSPTGHAHINPNGRYHFDSINAPPQGTLRPLRQRPTTETRVGQPSLPIPVDGDKH